MHTKLTNILLGGVCVDKARETARKRERGSVKEKDRECERVRQLKLLFISCCCCWKPKVIHLLTPFLLYSGVQLVSPLAINTKCAAGSVPGLSCAGVCRCGVCQWCASWAHFLTPFAFRLWLGKQVTWAFQQRPNCLRLMTGPAVKMGKGFEGEHEVLRARCCRCRWQRQQHPLPCQAVRRIQSICRGAVNVIAWIPPYSLFHPGSSEHMTCAWPRACFVMLSYRSSGYFDCEEEVVQGQRMA